MKLLAALGRPLSGQAYLLLVLTTFLWGANAVASRLAVGEITPMVIITGRWVIVVALLWAIAHRQVRAEWSVLRPYWWQIAILGALGFTVFNALFYGAAYHTTAVNIGLIQGIVPALAMLGSRLAYGTPIRPLQTVGLVVALAGVVIVASRGDLAVLRTLDFNEGDVWMVIASALYAGYTVAVRRRPPVSALTFFTAIAIAALITSIPFLGYEIATGAARWPTPYGYALLVFIALAPSLVAQIMYIQSIQLIGPARAGLFVNLVPVFAALLGVAILGEAFATYHALALALVIGGIWVAELNRNAAPSAAPSAGR